MMSQVSCFAFALLLAFASAEVDTGVANSQSGFLFLGNQCFDKTDSQDPNAWTGSIQVDLSTNDQGVANRTDIALLKYDDEDSSWPMIYDNDNTKYYDMSCEQKRTFSKDWPIYQYSTSLVSWSQMGPPWTFSQTYQVVERTRPRFWYLIMTTGVDPNNLNAKCLPLKNVNYK
jgi:hypothetical protein